MNHQQNSPKVVVSDPAPSGIKSKVSMFPGVMVLHRLLKNFRYWSDSSRGTVGGIRRAQMTVDEGAQYTESIFRKIDQVVKNSGGWEKKRILEIGPGDSLGTGLWCLGAGAESYTAIDRFAVGLDQVFEQKVFEAIKEKMPSMAKERCQHITQISEGVGHNNPGELFYKNDLPVESAPEVLGHSSFDVIFSNAVLEHVGDLRGTLVAMQHLLAEGGVMFHDVDLRSHQSYEDHPMHFLEYPESLWKWMSSHNGEPNRVRMPDYLRMLDEIGFEIIETGVSQVFDEELVISKRNHLAAKFKKLSIEELRPAVFWFACTKP